MGEPAPRSWRTGGGGFCRQGEKGHPCNPNDGSKLTELARCVQVGGRSVPSLVTARETYPLPGLIGWAVTLGSVVVYDTWASVSGHPTMSRTLGHYLRRPVLGPILAGAWLGLGYHLLVSEHFNADRLA